jgi:methylmalonyl-CoA mutase C-terminal domain/subunit
VLELLRAEGAGDKLVLGGGVIPEQDAEKLRAMGVAAVFTMGATTTEIIAFIERWWKQREAQ